MSRPHRAAADAELLRSLAGACPLAAGLPPAGGAALAAILAAPVAWSWATAPTDADAARALRKRLARLAVPPEAAGPWLAGLAGAGHAAETLAALRALGLVEPWPLPAGLAFTLTPRAAEALGVELAEFGPCDDPEARWVPAGHPAAPIRLRNRRGACDQALLPLLVDPRPHGADLILWRARERKCAAVLDEFTGKPLRLFRGEDGRGSGIPVVRDHRRDHPMKPARLEAGGEGTRRSRTTAKRATAADRAPGPGGFDLIDQYRAARRANRRTTG